MNGQGPGLGIAALMVVVGGLLVVWFWWYRRGQSRERMTQMLERVGVAPEVIARGDVQAIMKDVRSRCRTCNSEDTCERWLAGEVGGDNEFCPNAEVLRGLARSAGPAAR